MIGHQSHPTILCCLSASWSTILGDSSLLLQSFALWDLPSMVSRRRFKYIHGVECVVFTVFQKLDFFQLVIDLLLSQHVCCRCIVRTLANTSVTTSTMVDGLTSAACVTLYASFFLTDTDTTWNWLLRSWNGCGSCWQCCPSRARFDSTRARYWSCTTGDGQVRQILATATLPQLLTTIFHFHGRRQVMRRSSAE